MSSEIDEQILALRQALVDAPHNGQLHYLLGVHLASAGDYEQAIREITRALELEPALHIARFQLGLLYMTLNRPLQAATVWGPLELLGPGSPLVLFKRGLEALIRDDFSTCVILLEQGIAANRENEPLNQDMRMVIHSARQQTAHPASAPVSAPTVPPQREPALSGVPAIGRAETDEPDPQAPVRTDFSLYGQ